MSQEEAFLVEIAEHPDDPAARLIYADWLDEQGDARGEFIRIQEELGELPVESDRYQALRARRDELRPRIDSDWIACLNYGPTYRPLFTKIPLRRSDRWKRIDEFIDYWWNPLPSNRGFGADEIRQAEQRLGALPAALCEWYLLAGMRMDVWLDELVRPSNLQTSIWGNALMFRQERRGIARWGLRRDDLRHDDLPVYCFGAPYGHDATLASSSISKFAMAVILQNAMSARVIYASGHVGRDPTTLEELRPRLQRCALALRDPSGFRADCWEGSDLLAIESEAHGWLYLVVRTEEACEQLSSRLQTRLRRR